MNQTAHRNQSIEEQLKNALDINRQLQVELEEMNRGLIAVTIELEKRNEKIHKLNEELEQRVIERTAQLERVIKRLEREVTDRKLAEEAFKESEEKYRELVQSANSIILRMDNQGNITFFNSYAQDFFGYAEEEILGQNIIGTIIPNTNEQVRYLEEMLSNIALSPNQYILNEDQKMRKNGELVWVTWANKAIFDHEGMLTEVLCIGNDFTERKKAEDRLNYLSLHDQLTGLFNRTYFEEEMQRLESGEYESVGIIVCDVNGLKFVNDTLGHKAGDELLRATAIVLKESFRTKDVLARTGGDEFSIIIHECDKDVLRNIAARIRLTVKKYNTKSPELPLSLSIGFSVGDSPKLNEVFKEADNYMYREKLRNTQSARNAIVQTLMKALGERDFVTESHVQRLQTLIELLAVSLGLPEHSVNDLKLLAQFHDIGKVGIPDRILFKAGPLTPEERDEMKRHSEIGHRVALASPDMSPIADWILKHHEWWNGAGYPLGLSGTEIPLECRILSVVDAYDAMISDRPYRKAMSRVEAVAELVRCSGTQFDPEIVGVFIKVIKDTSI